MQVQEPAMFDTDISLYHLPLLHYWNTVGLGFQAEHAGIT